MNVLKKYKILLAIVCIATLLRLYNLGTVPVGPNWDEAALGYNAFSILKTGKDEFGKFLPLSLRSYDDYKPPLYVYLAIPAIAIFGLDLWSTRLPAAINGIIGVLGVFFLARQLCFHFEHLRKWKVFPYLSTFLLAISPWHIHFSRIAFEANVGVTLNIWALYFFFKGFYKKGSFLIPSGILFGLSLYAYHSQRIFATLLVVLLFIIFRKELLKQKKAVGMFMIALILTIAPLIPVFLDPTTLTRLRGTSAWEDTFHFLLPTIERLERDEKNNDFFGKVVDNRRFLYVKTIISGYLSHYSLRWLFVEGDNPRHHAPGMGLMYHLELPFFLIGVLHLFKNGGRLGALILGWMLIAPVAASPTRELPHAIRTLVFLPSLQFAVALGLLAVYRYAKRPFFILLVVAFFINFLYYLSSYFIQQNLEYSKYWQYGYKQAVEYAKAHYTQYDRIVASIKLEQPYMFFLFHLKYDPATYLAEGGTRSGEFKEEQNRFGKYEFRMIHWEKEVKDGKTLFIGKPSEILGNRLKTIYYLDGSEAIVIGR
jgi:4-amino-4-deoxy-L-arabinose transferase-like glycosyltransferase